MNNAIISAQNRLTTNGVFFFLRAIGYFIPFPTSAANGREDLPQDKSVGYYIITGILAKPSSSFLHKCQALVHSYTSDRHLFILARVTGTCSFRTETSCRPLSQPAASKRTYSGSLISALSFSLNIPVNTRPSCCSVRSRPGPAVCICRCGGS